MTRMSLAERRQKLIAAALAVIARSGVAAATTRAIASEAGMPLASFHYAFESHQALLAEATREVLGQELQVGSGAQLQAEEPAGLIAELLADHASDVQARSEEYQRILELLDHAFRTPGQEDVPRQWREERRDRLAARIEESVQSRQLALALPAPELADAVLTMCDGVTQTWLVTKDEQAVRRAIGFWSTSSAAA